MTASIAQDPCIHNFTTLKKIQHAKMLGSYVAQQNTAILEVSFDPDKGPGDSLSIVATINAGTQPQWLASHKNKMYAISRTRFSTAASTSCGVFAFQRPPATEAAGTPLKLLDTKSSHGQGDVHCDVSHDGRTLAATNNEASTMVIYPLSVNGLIGEAAYKVEYVLNQLGPGVKESQAKSFPHETAFDPSGRFLFVPARGDDRVHVYSVPSADRVKQLEDIIAPPGTGPRHTAFRPTNKKNSYLYLLGELDNTIRVYTIDYARAPHHLKSTLHQIISTLGPNLPRTPPDRTSLASEMAFTSDGRFAYACNRNTKIRESDTFAVYAIDDVDPINHLTYIAEEKTLGKIPRHFTLSPDRENRYLAVANEYSNDIVVFERDVQTGLMKGVKGRLSLGEGMFVARNGPACILWK